MSIMSEEQKIIDLENEISFLKDVLSEKQKEIEELKKPKYMINFETGTITTIDNNFISKDKIRELLKSKDIELTGVISYRELEELL